MDRAAASTEHPGFFAELPDPPPHPVVVSVPHAGIDTAGFQAALAASLDVRCDADLFVDELYLAGVARGASCAPGCRASSAT